MVDAQLFREAWGKFASGVSVVTSIEPDGGVHGMAANGINSVSLEPLLVLVCVGHNRNSYPLIQQSGRFCINILTEEQQNIAEYYAAPAEKRLNEPPAAFRLTENGAAVIEDSLASIGCRVVTEHKTGDHTIFIAEAEEIEVNSGNPLLFFEGKFGYLGRMNNGKG